MKNNLAVINAIIDEYYLCRSTPHRLLKRLIVAIKAFDEELREKRRVLDENFPSWKEPTDTLAYGARGTIIQINEVLGEGGEGGTVTKEVK